MYIEICFVILVQVNVFRRLIFSVNYRTDMNRVRRLDVLRVYDQSSAC